MHAGLNVRFELSIDEAKPMPLPALAEFVTEQDVESVRNALIERLDLSGVKALYGKKWLY